MSKQLMIEMLYRLTTEIRCIIEGKEWIIDYQAKTIEGTKVRRRIGNKFDWVVSFLDINGNMAKIETTNPEEVIKTKLTNEVFDSFVQKYYESIIETFKPIRYVSNKTYYLCHKITKEGLSDRKRKGAVRTKVIDGKITYDLDTPHKYLGEIIT